MPHSSPNYPNIPPEQLGRHSGVAVPFIAGGQEQFGKHLAQMMLDVITQAQAAGKDATVVFGVGPGNQYPFLVHAINSQKIDCRNVCLIKMDEYLTDDDQWIDADHPLCSRSFIQRNFYEKLNPDLAPLEENRVFPHPDRCDEIAEIIAARGGVDVCFGGIGINGHTPSTNHRKNL